jgi:putative radical SAM enzyme (TIGR03279 family)
MPSPTTSLPTVLEVLPGSPAEAAGLRPADELVSINGIIPNDVIEYQQLIDDQDPKLMLLRMGNEWSTVVNKAVGEPIGIRLNASIFDRVQTCDNHCEFCFIYQLPPGMRKSLYLKDDDYRLSFLYGNFTTLTRFTELDLSRVIEDRLGPLYVSIHATDPDVRAEMLRNRRGATSLRWLTALLDAGITVHGQVVLCPGINNGSVLEQTLAETITRYSKLATLGIVPLGLSKYNKEANLRVHTPAEATDDLEIIHFWQDRALDAVGRRIFQASDELYLQAGVEVPPSSSYEAFEQHENGIGMIRAFYDELDRLEHGSAATAPIVTGEWRSMPAAPAEGYRAPKHLSEDPRAGDGPVVVVTGVYGRSVMEPVLGRLERLAGRRIRLLSVPNDFFGGNTAVAGLMVGQDVKRSLEADTAPVGAYVLPDVALSSDTFIDDMSLSHVASSARAPVVVAEATVAGLLGAVR